MRDLVALAEISATFTDVSSDLRDYLRDTVSLSFTTGDKLYLGLYKPFNSTYIELVEAISGVSITYRYSSTASFESLSVKDDTKGLSRSGFITWDRNIEDWAEQDVNGQSLYWLEIEFNESYSFEVEGLNTVYSCDYDMDLKNPFVMDYLPKSDTSFIRYHVAVRNEIVQILRNGGYIKMPTGMDDIFFQPRSDRANIEKWDLLEFEEVREAAAYKAMAMVFFNESRNNDDKAYNLYRQYQGKFGESFKLFYLSLDVDDDGKTDSFERLANNEVTVTYE